MLKTENLCYEYASASKNSKNVLNNINISLSQGDTLGIIGKTGSGKSTLAQLLCGLLSPTSGTVIFKDTNIKKYPTPICFEIGFVCQYPENQLFCKTVFDDIAFGPKNKGLTEKEIKERVIEAANFTNLDLNLLNRSPLELSGGEKRKCAIAGVIAMDPSVLTLDEPTCALDPESRAELMRSLKQYHQEQNKTVIIISHIMEEIAFLCNKVLVLNGGEEKLFGSAEEVFGEYDKLKEIGLDVPLTKKVVHNINKTLPCFSKDIITPQNAKREILKFISK